MANMRHLSNWVNVKLMKITKLSVFKSVKYVFVP